MSKASRTARRAMAMTPPIAAASPPTGTWLRSQVVDWVGAGTAGAAGLFWLLGHVPGTMASIAIPEWVLFGLAVGVLRPWLGLVLTVAVVAFLGGAVDPPIGEMLRVVPIYGAAARVLIDGASGRGQASDPPAWVTLSAIAAGLLYIGTFATFLLAIGGVVEDIPYVGWLIGGPTAGMAGWIVASHVGARRHALLADVILVATVIAVIVALAAWAGVGGVGWFVFPAEVRARLAAFGYPTPTGMGLAIALPFAVAAAWRRKPVLAVPVAALVLFAIVLTESRGPLVALGAAALVAILAKRRVDRRVAAAIGATSVLVAAAFVVISFGTSPAAILAGLAEKAGGDSARVASWGAGLVVLLANPLFGGGWHALARYADQAALGTGTVQSHNLFLLAFSEGGLPLGLTAAAVVLYSAVAVWRNRQAHEAWLIAAVVVYLVCGIWDFPQTRSYAAVMGGVALGLAAVRIGTPDDEAAVGPELAAAQRRGPRDARIRHGRRP